MSFLGVVGMTMASLTISLPDSAAFQQTAYIYRKPYHSFNWHAHPFAITQSFQPATG